MSLKATKAGAVYTSDVISQGVGETDWVNIQTTLKCQPKEMTVLSGSTNLSLKTIEALSTGNEVVVYDGAVAKSGAVGTVSSVVGDNLPNAAVEFQSNQISHPSVTQLQNGNVFIAYNDATNVNGEFVIYDPATSLVVKSQTNFNSGYNNSNIKTCRLTNGNVVIAFADYGNSSYGTFMIYSPTGTVVKSKTVFAGVDVVSYGLLNICETQNGGFCVVWYDGTNGMMRLYDSAGTLVTTKTINTGNTQNFSCTSLINGNIFIAYTDIANSAGGTFVIYDQTGTLVKNETVFNTLAYNISTTLLLNGNVLVGFRDETSGASQYYGKFVIYNQLGTLVKSAIAFYSNIIGDNSIICSALNNGNVLIKYRKVNSAVYDPGLGVYKVFDINGNLVKDETQFDTFTSSYGMNDATCALSNGKSLVVYLSYSSGYVSRFRTINTNVEYNSDITTLALSGTPTKAWKSVDLPETYTSFEGTGKTLINNYPVTLTSSTVSSLLFNDINSGLLSTGDDVEVTVGGTDYVVEASNVVETPVVGTNLPLGEVIMPNPTYQIINSIDGPNICTLSNGNFVVIKIGLGFYGVFVIYDKNGNLVKDETPFNQTSTNGNYGYITTFPNGNFGISCISGASEPGLCVFTLWDSDGNVVKTQTVVTGSSYSGSILALQNNNFYYFYTVSGSVRFFIYNSVGVEIGIGQIVVDNGQAPVATLLQNGNVFVAYNNSVSPYNGKFAIYDSGGNVVKSPTTFGTASISYKSCVTLKNGNVFVAYNNGTTSGNFIIYDVNGLVVKSSTIFNTGNTNSIHCTVLLNGNVLIAYTDVANSSTGSYVIYDQDGNLVKSETIFNSTGRSSFIGCTSLLNGNAVISYMDGGNSDSATFNIIDTGRYSTYNVTIPAQVSAPTAATVVGRSVLNVPYSYSYLSSNLNITYQLIQKTARDLRFKHISKNINDICTATTFVLNKAAS